MSRSNLIGITVQLLNMLRTTCAKLRMAREEAA